MLSIPFVGELRSKILEEKGFTLGIIKNCKVEDIAKIDGFSLEIAKKIQKYAKMVDKNYLVPKQTIFREFRCPDCNAIVSEIEYKCHKCGKKFFNPVGNYDEKMDELAQAIVEIYKDPANPELWRKGEKILEEMDIKGKAADFKFKASTLELQMIEEEEEGEETVELPQRFEQKRLKNMYKKGLTNGLVNGFINGYGIHRRLPEQKMGIRALLLSLIIIVPVVMAAFFTYAAHSPISIDGKFEDWKDIPSLNIVSSYFTSFKIKNYDGYSYIYISSHGFFLNNSPQYFAILIDYDGSKSTGFPAQALGVDYILSLYGTKNNLTKYFGKFESGEWHKQGDFVIGFNSKNMEISTMRLTSNTRLLLYYNDGQEHYSSIISLKPVLTLKYTGGTVISSGNTEIEKIEMWNSYRGNIRINSFKIFNMGNSSSTIRMEWGDNQQTIDISVGNNTVNLNSPIIVNGPTEIHIFYVSGGFKYGTLKFKIYTNYSQIEVDKDNGSYITSVPAKKSVDGIFLDWKDSEASPREKIPANIDLRKYGKSTDENIMVYLNVYGMLFGTGAPEIRFLGGNATGGNQTKNITMPLDTIEIYVDSDRNIHTGYRIGNIGAEYKILLIGDKGEVSKEETYRWNSGWIETYIGVDEAKDYDSIEIGLALQGNVYFRLVNFQGIWDEVNENFQSVVVPREVEPVHIGTFNSTEFFTRFGSDVDITTVNGGSWSGDQQFPSITSNGSALFVAFNTSYKSGTHNLGVGIGYSTDNGNTWNAFYFSNVWGEKPVITTNDYGDVYVFFENHTTGSDFEYLVHYHTNSTNEPWIKISVDFSSFVDWEKSMDIAAASHGTYIYATFANQRTSDDVGCLFVSDSNNWFSNTHWYWAGWVAKSPNDEYLPRVAITTGSNAQVFVTYIVYKQSSLGNFYYNEVWYNYSAIGTGSWSAGTRLKVSDGVDQYDDDVFPDISATDNYAYIVWEHDYYNTNTGKVENTDLFMVNISASSGTILSTTRLTSGSSYWEQAPSIWANGNDLYIAYYNATSSGEYIYYIFSLDGGSSWSSPQQISDHNAVDSYVPMVDVYYHNGYVYVVWSDDSPGNADIFFDKETIPEMPNPYITLILIASVLLVFVQRKRNKY